MLIKLFIYTITFCSALHISEQSIHISDQCDILFDGVDLKTKKRRKELAPKRFFHYTPPEIRNELRGDALLSCHGQLLKIEDETFLNLNVQVHSQLSRSHYGSVDAGSLLRITLINGREIKLNCRTGSRGERNSDSPSFVYPLSYELSSSDLRALSRMEIDEIGIQWSSGFEKYTIFEVDFLINQIACLRVQSTKQN